MPRKPLYRHNNPILRNFPKWIKRVNPKEYSSHDISFIYKSQQLGSAVGRIIAVVSHDKNTALRYLHRERHFVIGILADNLFDIKAILLAVRSCAAKGCIMGLTIALWLLPTFIPEASPLRAKMSVFQTMFSITQFVTALIGFVYFYIVWKPVKKVIKWPEVMYESCQDQR